MSYKLEDSVIREVEKTFPPELVGAVCKRLEETELPMERSAPPPRVHIAVIWLSKGDLEKFNYELDGAACDWRDTLVAAGLAGEDWRDILQAKKIESGSW